MGETLADGLAGNLEPGSATFPLVRDHVAAVVQASEPEIEEAHPVPRARARARRRGRGRHAVAAVLAGRVELGAERVVVVVSGRNIALPRSRPSSRTRNLRRMPCLIALFALIGPGSRSSSPRSSPT